MKIVYFHYLGEITCVSIGPSVHIREFVGAMIGLGNRVTVYPPLRFSAENAIQEVRKISKYGKQIKILLQNFKKLWLEYRIVMKEKPDIIIARHSLLHFSSLIVSKWTGIPIALEVNAPMAHEAASYFKEFSFLPFLPLVSEKITLKLADVLIVVSEELKAYFIENGIRGEKIHVVPNGVDVNRFHFSDKNAVLMKKHGIGSDRIVIGFIGSFSHWHGVNTLLGAFSNVVRKHRSVVFLLVGDGFARPALEREAETMGIRDRMIFSGLVSHADIPDYLSLMDIVIAPYPEMDLFYFSPLKLFEYLAAAKPVVATRIGQIVRIIDDGENGWLYDSGDLTQFENRLESLITDGQLRRRMGQKARETVDRNYEWNICAERIQRICLDLIRPSE